MPTVCAFGQLWNTKDCCRRAAIPGNDLTANTQGFLQNIGKLRRRCLDRTASDFIRSASIVAEDLIRLFQVYVASDGKGLRCGKRERSATQTRILMKCRAQWFTHLAIVKRIDAREQVAIAIYQLCELVEVGSPLDSREFRPFSLESFAGGCNGCVDGGDGRTL